MSVMQQIKRSKNHDTHILSGLYFANYFNNLFQHFMNEGVREMAEMLDVIKSRKSIRKFTLDKDVSDETIKTILETGRWAPSGTNNQPWRFIVTRDENIKEALAKCTHYGKIIRGAPVLITVFFDQEQGYNRTKDIQAIGACIENMLIAIQALDLGAVWLGEILNRRNEVEKILSVPESFELQAVIALGQPLEEEKSQSRSRVALNKIVWRDKHGNPF